MGDFILDVEGAQLAVSDEGEGPIIVHAHGLTQSRGIERDVGLMNPDPLVKVGYRVISYDARGHGESTGSREPQDYTWEMLADDLLRLIDHVSPNQPVLATGISMGTATILHCLIKAPERFRAVALGAPPTAWASRADQADLYRKMATTVSLIPEWAIARMMQMAPIPGIFRGLPNYPPPPSPTHKRLPAVLRGAALSDLPDPALLTKVTTPTLILAWDTDTTHPLSTSQRLQELLPDSTLEVASTFDSIQTWPAHIIDFFARH